jgi:class 3 adenylate cyclase
VKDEFSGHGSVDALPELLSGKSRGREVLQRMRFANGPSCGANNKPRAKFCNDCGAPLNASTPAAATVAPHDVAGERRHLTVLFCDLVGSTEIASHLDPEQWREIVVEHLLVKDDQAVVELHSLATAKNGLRFDNRYCWVVHFDGDTIDRVRAYLDSEMVARLFEENPI